MSDRIEIEDVTEEQEVNIFHNGKIYKIFSLLGEEVYYGSTCQKLSDRYDGHKSHYKRWKKKTGWGTSVYQIFEKYGVDNCRIGLVEEYPCETRQELLTRENYYIQKHDCVNLIRAFRDPDTIKLLRSNESKLYAQRHPERIRAYYLAHKEEVSISGKAKRKADKQARLHAEYCG